MQITLSNRRDNTRRSGQKTLMGNSEEERQMANIHMKRKKHANGNKMSYHLQNHVEKNFKFDNKRSQFCLERQAVSYMPGR